ncbi:hypothetical protein C0Q70_01001 [Pomacea canaliculata]|uniref:Cytochrome P450 n=1 Tax=Pomacea canaliculata TaxID=400727 RepID=A0A2T7PYB5_POMCA|nr:hypothetical protein C0Q70_01001 [Pomacea canaliculata]
MEHHIQRCSTQLTKNIEEAVRKGEKIEVKRFFGAYTMDVIAGTAFGLEVNSQKDLDHPFVRNAASAAVDLSSQGSLLVLLAKAFPFLTPLIKFLIKNVFHPRGVKSFIGNIRHIIKERKLEGTANRKPDLLQLILSCESNETDRMNVMSRSSKEYSTYCSFLIEFSDKVVQKMPTLPVAVLSRVEVVAQALTFFGAGYETTASTLQFMAHSLALHPEVQEKIVCEIKEQLGDEIPTYEGVSKLKYLDGAIHETLRMYPPSIAGNRMASEEVTIKGVTIPKGAGVMIPIGNVMKDPEYFPEPDKFIPERFSEGSIDPISFLAFGFGPRLCIGMRLALLEMKMAMVHVLRRIKFMKTDDLQETLKIQTGTRLRFPDQAIVIKAVMRDNC